MELREVAGTPDATGMHVGVALSTFNAVVTDGLLEGALAALDAMGAERVTLVRVPGALELPLVARQLAEVGCEAIVALGAVIEGETDHYQHVAAQSAAGLREAALASGVPVGNAVLTVRKLEHARERSVPGPGNKGAEAARAAVTAAQALRALVD